MTRPCPTTEEMLLLLDGELTENRAKRVREHLEGCAECRGGIESMRALVRDLAEPVEPRPGALERVLARLNDEPLESRAGRWKSLAAGLAGLVAAAAAVALAPAVGHHREAASGLTARGGPPERSLARDVGVTLYRHATRLEPLVQGDEVGTQTAYAVAFRNLGPGGSAHVMVFAQDAARELHWIEPVWLDPAEDPASVPLPHAELQARPRGSVVLDGPAVGALHLFVLVTPQPLRVSDVERLAGTTVDVPTLHARWPEATVDETVVRVAPAAGGETP